MSKSRMSPAVRSFTIFVTFLLAGVLFIYIKFSFPPPPPYSLLSNTELVLKTGATVWVTSSRGSISIIAGEGLSRQYQWDECVLDSHMSPRTKRWLGSLGAYDSAARWWTTDHLLYPSCKGVNRTAVQEGQIHFANRESAEEWLRHLPAGAWTSIWTNDGLVVSWIISPQLSSGGATGAIGVDLYLVCINGQRPIHLAGAADYAIKLEYTNGPTSQAVRECANVGSEVIAETQRDLLEEWKTIERYLRQRE